jgi:hypothetical protein
MKKLYVEISDKNFSFLDEMSKKGIKKKDLINKSIEIISGMDRKELLEKIFI